MKLLKFFIIFYRSVFFKYGCKKFKLEFCYSGRVNCSDCIKNGYDDLIDDMNNAYNKKD